MELGTFNFEGGAGKFELVTLIFLMTYEDGQFRDGQPHAQHLLDGRLPVHIAFVTPSFARSAIGKAVQASRRWYKLVQASRRWYKVSTG